MICDEIKIIIIIIYVILCISKRLSMFMLLKYEVDENEMK